MSTPMQYYGRGTHMSADLRAITKRVRKNRPDLFALGLVRETSMNGEGLVSTIEKMEAKATPLSGQARHRLSLQKERY